MEIIIGCEYVWEPYNSFAREEIRVIDILTEKDETFILSEGPLGLAWNYESRFKEACIPLIRE